MKIDSKIKTVLLAVLGLVFMGLYFWLFANTEISRLLQFRVPKSDIIVKAEQAFQESHLAEYRLHQEVELKVNNTLAHYAQVSPDEVPQDYDWPVGEWVVSWRGKIDGEGEENESVRFIIRYDLSGNLNSFEQDLPSDIEFEDLGEAQAVTKTKTFLASFEIDTSSLEISQKRMSEKGNNKVYNFTFATPSTLSENLEEEYFTEILGSEIIKYGHNTKLDQDKFKFPKHEDTSEIVAHVLAGLVWVVISILLLVTFVKRFRHDEIEFKRALWLGSLIALITWLIVAVNAWPEWWEMLLAGGMSALFSGGALFIAFAATESFSREVWPEKIALIDHLFRGHLRVKEMGQAILNSFFIAGLTILIFGAAAWLISVSNLGYIKIEEDSLWIFQGVIDVVSTSLGGIVQASFFVVILLFFGGTYLESKIKNRTIRLILFGAILLFSGLYLSYLRPVYLSVMLILPVAFLLAYFTRKYDFLTVFLAMFGFYYLLDLSLIGLSPDGYIGAAGITSGILGALLFTTGLALVYSKASIKEFGDYVPEYVSRIAERERLLKELEIARSVQMRFLPQSIPEFRKLEIASICRPALEVGGDYYDFITRSEKHLSVLIGDVSGKGVSAAFYMTMTKGIIKTLSKRIESPKILLTELNEIFYENTPKEVFISAIYGMFDMQKKTLTFARAGHNPLIVWKSVGSEPEMLNPKGIAIGLEPGRLFAATIEEITIPIDAGDMFVYYTDGISEAMNKNGDEFGEDRLNEIIGQNGQQSADTLLQKITTEVDSFSGDAKQHDDFTMVIVKVKE